MAIFSENQYRVPRDGIEIGYFELVAFGSGLQIRNWVVANWVSDDSVRICRWKVWTVRVDGAGKIRCLMGFWDISVRWLVAVESCDWF